MISIKLSNNLATRNQAQRVFYSLINNNVFIIDFKNVEVLSRSFANEFVNLEKKHNIKIEKINLNINFKYMFNIADKVLDNDILKRNKYSVINANKYKF